MAHVGGEEIQMTQQCDASAIAQLKQKQRTLARLLAGLAVVLLLELGAFVHFATAVARATSHPMVGEIVRAGPASGDPVDLHKAATK